MKILEVKNLSVSFDSLKVIEGLNFDVEDGDSLAIIGPNGSGKTVLLRTILGINSYKGEIKWKEGLKLGYVPQRLEIDRSLPLTLKEFLDAKINILKSDPKELDELLDLVKISKEMLNKSLGKLSSGQFQRALIIFAMIGNPNVLLFDEPTASVDSPSEEQIYETLHKLQHIKKLTIILISHDLSLVYHYANKVLCLNKQQICFGAPEEMLTTENLHKLYGAPRKYYKHIHGTDN